MNTFNDKDYILYEYTFSSGMIVNGKRYLLLITKDGWLAEIVGTSETFGYKRDFQQKQDSIGGRKLNEGLIAFILSSKTIYEYKSNGNRGFIILQEGEIIHVSPSEFGIENGKAVAKAKREKERKLKEERIRNRKKWARVSISDDILLKQTDRYILIKIPYSSEYYGYIFFLHPKLLLDTSFEDFFELVFPEEENIRLLPGLLFPEFPEKEVNSKVLFESFGTIREQQLSKYNEDIIETTEERHVPDIVDLNNINIEVPNDLLNN